MDAVCRSDSSTRSPHTLHWSLGDCDGVHRVDVAVDLHCSGRLGVDAVVSVQHAAAAVGSAFSSDDSDCSESRTSMRHSNARWNDGLPRAAGSRWIARRWRRPCGVTDRHMSNASSAREYAIAASPGSTSPKSSSRRTTRDPAANSVAASSPYETTRGRRGDSQIERGAGAEVSCRVDDSAVTRHVRVSC